MKGVAAELAEVRPHITLIGLWSDELVKMLTGDFAATATARAINALLDIPAAVVSGALAFVGECAAHRGPVLCVVHPMPTPRPLWMCVVCAV